MAEAHFQILESKFSSKLGTLRHLVARVELHTADGATSSEVAKLSSKLVVALPAARVETITMHIYRRKSDRTLSAIGSCLLESAMLDTIKHAHVNILRQSDEAVVGRLHVKARCKRAGADCAWGDIIMQTLPDFTFSRPSRSIDWNRLRNLDMNKIALLNDTRKLEAFIPDIAFGDFSEEESDPRLLRCLSAAQFTVQYQTSCASFLESRVGVIEAAVRGFDQEEDLLDLHLAKMRARVEALQREDAFLEELCDKYTAALRAADPGVDLGRAELVAPVGESAVVRESAVASPPALRSGETVEGVPTEKSSPHEAPSTRVTVTRAAKPVRSAAPERPAAAAEAGDLVEETSLREAIPDIASEPPAPTPKQQTDWVPATRKVSATVPQPSLSLSGSASVYAALARLAEENQHKLPSAAQSVVSLDSLDVSPPVLFESIAPSPLQSQEGGGGGFMLQSLLGDLGKRFSVSPSPLAPTREDTADVAAPTSAFASYRRGSLPDASSSSVAVVARGELDGTTRSVLSSAMSSDSLNPRDSDSDVSSTKSRSPVQVLESVEEERHGYMFDGADAELSPTQEKLRRNSIKEQTRALRASLGNGSGASESDDDRSEARSEIPSVNHFEAKHSESESEQSPMQSVYEDDFVDSEGKDDSHSEVSTDYLPSIGGPRRSSISKENATIQREVLQYIHDDSSEGSESGISPLKYTTRRSDLDDDDVLMGTSQLQITRSSALTASTDMDGTSEFRDTAHSEANVADSEGAENATHSSGDLRDTPDIDLTPSPFIWQSGRVDSDLIELGKALEMLAVVNFDDGSIHADFEVQFVFGNAISTPLNLDGQGVIAHIVFDRALTTKLGNIAEESPELMKFGILLRDSLSKKVFASVSADLLPMKEGSCPIVMQEIEIFEVSSKQSLGVVVVDIKGHQLLESL